MRKLHLFHHFKKTGETGRVGTFCTLDAGISKGN